MSFIAFAFGLFLTGTAVVLIARALAVPRMRAERTLGRIGDYGFSGAAAEATPEGRIIGPLDVFAGVVGTVLGARLPFSREHEVRKHLLAAGMYRVEPRKLMGYQVMSGGAFVFLAIWSAGARGMDGGTALLLIVMTALIGWYLPLMLIKRKGRMRLQQIEYELPELVDLLVVTVEAGLGFGAALKVASSRLQGPLGEEMRLALQEQNMGLSTKEALKNMLARAETRSMRSFVRAIVQGEQLGISIGQILRALADEMRKIRRAAAEERAQKAPIKLLFPLVFLIFPAMFVILLGPAVFAFLEALGG